MQLLLSLSSGSGILPSRTLRRSQSSSPTGPRSWRVTCSLAATNWCTLRAQGLNQGDCVAFVLPNSGAVLEIFMAAAQAGWFITPINSHLAVGEMAYILEDCGAKAVFGSARYAERLAPACDQAA